MGKTALRETLQTLAAKGWIKILDTGNNISTHYRIYLPRERVSEYGYRNPILEFRVSESDTRKTGIEIRDSKSDTGVYRIPTPVTRYPPEREISKNLPQEKRVSESESRNPDPLLYSLLSNRVTLSLADQLIDKFYTMVGQPKISKKKRERAREDIQSLLQEGFTFDELSYAIDWVSDHLAAEVHSFGIIPEIIGQALKDREEARRVKEQLDRARAREVAEERRRVAEEATRRRIEEVKASLPPETLEELNREASRLLEETPGARPTFGQEILLKMKVDELIKHKYLESS